MQQSFAVLDVDMQKVLKDTAGEGYVGVILDWLVDESLQPSSSKTVERHFYLKVSELNVRRVNSGAGFNELIVGSFVGKTAGPEWTITVTVEQAGRGETKATYTRYHPSQR